MTVASHDTAVLANPIEDSEMPNARKRTPVVPAKVKAAIAVLLDQTVYDLAAAASAAGLSTARLRRELKKAHCLQYMRAEKAALIEEVCAGNPVALAEIRAKSENAMARVAAIRQSEAMRQVAHQESPGGRQMVPGLVVIIEGPGGSVRTIAPPVPAPPMIEHEPLPEREETRP